MSKVKYREQRASEQRERKEEEGGRQWKRADRVEESLRESICTSGYY